MLPRALCSACGRGRAGLRCGYKSPADAWAFPRLVGIYLGVCSHRPALSEGKPPTGVEALFSGMMPSLPSSDELIFFVNGRKVSLHNKLI